MKIIVFLRNIPLCIPLQWKSKSDDHWVWKNPLTVWLFYTQQSVAPVLTVWSRTQNLHLGHNSQELISSIYKYFLLLKNYLKWNKKDSSFENKHMLNIPFSGIHWRFFSAQNEHFLSKIHRNFVVFGHPVISSNHQHRTPASGNHHSILFLEL